jgi:2-hydroxychromene-2-carboxylate isomerase
VAALTAVVGWCPAFARAAYRARFLENKDPGQVEHLSTILEGLGREPAKIIALTNSEEVRDRYAAETEVARFLGIFGSPSFV